MSQGQAIRENTRGAAQRKPLSAVALLAVVAATLAIVAPVEADCPDYHWACANGSDITFGTCFRFPQCSVCNSNWQDECRGKDIRCNEYKETNGKVWHTPEARVDGCSAPKELAGMWNEIFRKACNEHDICYGTPGRTKGSCDAEFGHNMVTLCYTTYPGDDKSACLMAAAAFETAVDVHPDAVKGYRWGQEWALNQHCGVVPATANVQEYENEDLRIAFIENYELLWNDAGSGAKADVSFWRPTPAPGWYLVGHHAKLGHGVPTGSTMVVQEKKPGILVEPHDYTEIWNDRGSGAYRDVSIWRPLCPSGSFALGDVASGSHAKPTTAEIRCIRSQKLVPTRIGAQIWNDSGSGATRDFAAWNIDTVANDPGTPLDAFGNPLSGIHRPPMGPFVTSMRAMVPLNRGLFLGTGSYDRPTQESSFRAILVPMSF